MSDSGDAAVLVPLYIYPFEGAWQPLYDAIAAHPRTQYLVIVNPGNGPGPGSLPDANYCREIPKLRSQPNVAVYGYVHVQWAQRDLETVLHDVEIYQAWPNHDATMAVDGIFVDETPTAADARTVAFLGSLTSLVHRIWPNASGDSTSGDSPVAPTPVPGHVPGAGPDARTAYNTPLPTIIHNPGCMPARALLELTDLCVVFEDTWTVFLQRVADGVFDDDYHERQAQLLLQQEQEQSEEEVTTADAAADDVPSADATEATAAAAEDAGSMPEAQGQAQDPPQLLPTPPPEKQVPVLPDRRKRAVVVHSVPLPAMVSLLSESEKIQEGGEPSGNGNTDTDTDAEVNSTAGVHVQGKELEVGKVDDASAMIDNTADRAAKVKEVIDAARRVAGTVFVTELHEGFYERFGPGWGEWARGFNGVGKEVEA